MEPVRSIEELTRRNVAIIAEMEKAAADHRNPGERVADRIAAWVGSWTFIVVQTVLLLLWIALNVAPGSTIGTRIRSCSSTSPSPSSRPMPRRSS